MRRRDQWVASIVLSGVMVVPIGALAMPAPHSPVITPIADSEMHQLMRATASAWETVGERSVVICTKSFENTTSSVQVTLPTTPTSGVQVTLPQSQGVRVSLPATPASSVEVRLPPQTSTDASKK